MSRAIELFLADLMDATVAARDGAGKRITLQELQDTVAANEKFDFLVQVLANVTADKKQANDGNNNNSNAATKRARDEEDDDE